MTDSRVGPCWWKAPRHVADPIHDRPDPHRLEAPAGAIDAPAATHREVVDPGRTSGYYWDSRPENKLLIFDVLETAWT
jgi:hypothetical protein